MPTTTQRDNDPQSSSLSAIREGQAAVIDVLRVWADIGQQLTRDLRLPVAASTSPTPSTAPSTWPSRPWPCSASSLSP